MSIAEILNADVDQIVVGDSSVLIEIDGLFNFYLPVSMSLCRSYLVGSPY
jgi:hypothetical protein